MRYLWISSLILLVSSCDTQDSRENSYQNNEEIFYAARSVSVVSGTLLHEVSGLEFSSRNNGMLWAHNDSGNLPILFLLDTSGAVKMQVHLLGVHSIDWEDITLAPPYLYIADIGDNTGIRDQLFLHRIMEPLFTGQSAMELAAKDISTMTFTYANGPRDAETLLYDQHADELIVVTKREQDCLIFPFHFQETTGLIKLQAAGSLPLRLFTGGDINEDGEVLMKNYDTIFYWEASDTPAGKRLIKGPDFTIPYQAEPQGEAICWDEKGGFYTVSEFNKYSQQHLYYYQRMK